MQPERALTHQQNVKVLISRDLPGIPRELLEKQGFLVNAWKEKRPMNPPELLEAARGSDAFLSIITDKIDAQFLQASRHLQIISQFGVGYDNIDIAEATRLGIPVANTPGAMTQATADIAFGLMIASSRKMFYMHKKILEGKWGYFEPRENLGIELSHKTLGVFGLGRIGTEMANRCKAAYSMDIIYCNRKPNAEAEKLLGARRVSFEKLLKASDIISVHAALSDETRGIFNASAFERMKPTAIFINTSRGMIHQEQDLIEALASGKIWGAGLDVSNPEPMTPENPLLFMENVCVLPHIGSATVEARTEMSRLAAENIISFYQNRSVPYLLNPEVLQRR